MAGLGVTSIILAIFGLIFLWKANEDLGKQEVKQIKTQDELEEKAFQSKIREINPDKLIGNKRSWIAFKGNKLIGALAERILDNSAYMIGDNKIIILLPAPNGVNIIPSLGEKEDQEIVEYLDKINIPMVQYSFVIHETDDLKEYVEFNAACESAYKTDKKEKLFSISGSKKIKLKWRLVKIEFSPHYVTDYEVETESEETGRVGGHAGSAVIGGLIGGTTGAVIGSSLESGISSTTVSHSSNSANEREVAAPALLTIENQNGDVVKISEQCYEEDIIYLKKYFLVENKKDDGSSSLSDELKRLKELVDEKIITQEEFELGKKKLLNS